MMNAIQRFSCLMLGAALLPAVSSRAAVMTINTTEPSGALISVPHSPFNSSTPGPVGERDTFTTAFPPTTYGSRGQTWTMPDNPSGTTFNLNAVTIRADVTTPPAAPRATQDFSSDAPGDLKLWIFQWNPSTNANTNTNWIAGDGSSDLDPFDGTGISVFPVNGETFDINRTFNGEFIHFSTPGVVLNENMAYGLLVSYTGSNTAGLILDQVRDDTAPNGQTYLNGASLRSDASANTEGASGDDLVFYVEATAVPEPALAGLGLALLAALPARRRRFR